MEDNNEGKPDRFRFKRPRSPSRPSDAEPSSKHSRRERFETTREDHPAYKCKANRHHHGKDKHRPKRRKYRSFHPEFCEEAAQNGYETKGMDAETAFRESLFDALADDEGAEYWTHLYGEPIHTYPRSEAESRYGGCAIGDDEYAKWVREQMWARSHEHVIEERERREARARREDKWKKAKYKAKLRAEEMERERMEEEERARERKKEKEWRRKFREGSFEESMNEETEPEQATVDDLKWTRAWNSYQTKWEGLKDMSAQKTNKGDDNNEEKSRTASIEIPWPVQSGKAKHVKKEAVEAFFSNGLSGLDRAIKRSTLRAERVRWHPDKIQHRFGGQNINGATMKLVNSVFLVVDDLYNEIKGKR
ncbi:MAG: hypothetical protein M1820_009158 [Bogoriella megaspora]|nr:MAG: hypothetical protein M1820_009158 [Bogoriella megaspora]